MKYDVWQNKYLSSRKAFRGLQRFFWLRDQRNDLTMEFIIKGDAEQKDGGDLQPGMVRVKKHAQERIIWV